MNNEQLREYVCLQNRKLALDAELKQVRQELDSLEEVLVPQFVEDAVQKVTCDGRTVSLAQEVRAAMVNGRENVVSALRAAGLEEFVGVNHQGLGAYVRELAHEVEDAITRENQTKPVEAQRLMTEEDVHAALPEPLRAALRVSISHVLRSRKA